MGNDFESLPLVKISPAPTVLRPVLKETVEYMELLDSVRQRGILNSILVRPHPSRDDHWQVIDGMWRYSVSQDLVSETIPCIIKEGVTDEEILTLQIEANAVSYATRPVEFSDQLQKIVELREDMGLPITLAELGNMVGKSASWVRDRLMIQKLSPHCKVLLRDGSLSLGKALSLTIIREWHLQDEFVGKWETRKIKKLNNREFELEVGRFRNAGHARARGQAKDYLTSPLRPRLQRLDTLLTELDNMEMATTLITQHNAQTPLQGARLMLEWVLNLDQNARERKVREASPKLTLRERLELVRRQQYDEYLEDEDD